MAHRFLATMAACLTLVLPAAAVVVAPSATAEPVFTLPPLPYAPSALEPVIDTETMTIHHDRHHQAYVDALNVAVSADPALGGMSLEQLVASAGTLPTAVRNNAGGHWNHSFFWTTMTAPAQTGEPSPELQAALQNRFGSMEEFQSQFNAAGTQRFGSGWAWLIVGQDGQLAITSTPNQDNPLMDVADVKGTPLMGNDVWEHAYYLKHQNRRGDYLSAWWQVVDWNVVSQRFADTA
ncbi:superoxide dismutase [Mycolicibacterium tokaiense]|uniref:Superoxide dismutase n=1 Tax=Mycolicibacterium tokaiense TaxID=39695 RepID=A0A378TEM3_9MYCO|nr:superoxide dismutase [Mycolicibacterium tokaiense]BBY86251.1 superoxide dismutase [Mycolicibacterium tokaiense]STZ59238.1 superoxide dismutase SodM [Mycolicibacterium tokaiense]